MLKYVLFIVLMLITCSETYSQSVLKIKFNSIDTGTVIMRRPSNQVVDTIQFTNGIMEYHADLPNPELFNFWLLDYNESRPMELLLSNMETEVQFDKFIPAMVSNNIDSSFPNTPAFLKDPNKNQVLYQFKQKWIAFNKNIDHFSTGNEEENIEQRKAIYLSFINDSETIIKDNKQNPIAAVIIDFLLRDHLLQLEMIQNFYDYLSPEVKDSFMGLKIGEVIDVKGRLIPGNQAPEFNLSSIDGKKYSLVHLKGKKVLLHFWSSTCAPCIREAPELLKFEEEYGKKITVVNISTDTDEDKWQKGIERAGFKHLINICDLKGTMGGIAQAFDISMIPACYLLDEQGKIMGNGTFRQMKALAENN